MRVLCLLALLLGLASATARAEPVELDSCIDGNGQTIRAEQDSSLKVLVQSGMSGGQRIIRYNPDVFPKLSATAMQFFFAHECARAAAGDAPGARPNASRAQSADCVGVTTLQASGLLKDAAAVEALQAELVFSDDQWAQLPGPRRAFNLTACPRQTSLAIPRAAAERPDQAEWDSCIRVCGDRSFRCQGKCRGADCDGCQAAYDRCQAACDSR